MTSGAIVLCFALAPSGPVSKPVAHINAATGGTLAIRKASETAVGELIKKMLFRRQMERANTTLVRVIVRQVGFTQLRDL